MKKMGFDEKLINLIMKCISTVSYSVLINGVAYGCITPTRGLHQGDPISPYLFLLCFEGFTCLIMEAARNKKLSRISTCRGSPRITHLLFADDSILYCRVSGMDNRELVNILQKYEEVSSQKINTDKSSIFFSQDVDERTRSEVKEIIGPMLDAQPKKDLGLPSLIGRLKKQVFNEVKERVGKNLIEWKGKMLSIGRREILIKVVAQVAPTYTIRCFLLLKGLCEDIERMMRNFC